MSEIQKFPRTDAETGGDLDPYEHFERGFLFTFGLSIYLMTRQEHEGTSIKLWVISQIQPLDKITNSAASFYGVLYPTSSAALYASTGFFCRRIEQSAPFEGKYMRLADIPDAEARTVLGEQLTKFPLRYG